jgi:small ligand-binding sensory domain FIST
MAFGAALSEHPLTALAVGEVTGSLLEQVGDRPDLVVVFVTTPHGGALEDVAATIDTLLHPLVLIGCAAESVVGTAREVERGPAVSLWAGHTGPVVPVLLEAVGTPADWKGVEDVAFTGWPTHLPFRPGALLLSADPFSFPAQEFLNWLERHHPGLPVIGGYASGGRGPGGSRLVLGTRVQTTGAVGALLGPGIQVDPVVSQGCRPFGQPLVVTRADQHVIFELAGKPALERLSAEALSSLSPPEVTRLENGALQIGRVIDEHRYHFGPGDFLIRSVLGSEPRSGALAVGEIIPVGTTVQFHLRDAPAADQELHALLDGRRAHASLIFTCSGRGARLFEQSDHDARVLASHLGKVPTAGFFAAGEFGPVGGRNFLHGFTASIALLSETPGDSP